MIDSSPKAIEKRARRIHRQAAGVRQGLAVVFVCAGLWLASTAYDAMVGAEIDRRVDALRAESLLLNLSLGALEVADVVTDGERAAKALTLLRRDERRIVEGAAPRWRFLVGGAVLGLALGLSIGIPIAAALQLYALRALADLNRDAIDAAVASSRRNRQRRDDAGALRSDNDDAP